MATTNKITAGKVLGYALMPRIWPRTKNLFATGFSGVAFLMAQVYAMVRLLPPAHPYLNPANKGKFGIRHVIAEAANRLVLKKENFDQIIIFFALLTGVVLLALQFGAIIYSVLFQPALAQLEISMFNTPHPEKDIALTLLDRVFGIPKLTCNVAGTCTEINSELPFAFHTGLHGMLQFYSLGILLVGVLIFLYYIVIIVGETATTGSPFGQRFQNIWVPIRLVTAIGLLLPLNYGLNSAQYITLYAAKFGSGLATNGWIQFNRALADEANSNANEGYDDRRESIFPGENVGDDGKVSDENFSPLGEKETLLALPKSPDVSPMVQFMALAHACAYGYWKHDINQGQGTRPPNANFYIKPYFIKHPFLQGEDGGNGNNQEEGHKEVTNGTSYKNGLDFYKNGDIVIRFGERDKTKYKNERGNVYPTCGEIRVQVSNIPNRGQGATQGGPDQIQEFYFNKVKELWFNTPELKDLSHQYMEYSSLINSKPCEIKQTPNCERAAPPGEIKQEIIDRIQGKLNAEIIKAWEKYSKENEKIKMTQEIFERGWGGAGIWYNKIAEINGGFITAANQIPTTGQDGVPAIMKKVRDKKASQDTEVTGTDIYCPTLSSPATSESNTIPGIVDNPKKIAQGLCDYIKYWNKDDPNQESNERVPTGNAFTDAMMFIFGQRGLFEMRKENASVHPLAQLSALGKGLVDSAIVNIGGSSVFAFGGGITASLGMQKTSSGLQIASSALNSIAFIGLVAGFILFYILPFMPFIYFFFAVGSWIKTIFEAMVGVPLWALAHLRIDGEGLPGESAINGYLLIFEIFLRPILTVFGLVAALVIFTTQVRTLHFIWDLVTDNLSGFQGETTRDVATGTNEYNKQILDRGIIDKFFFTIIYAIIVYMLGTSSFKLIDKIPDNILRWMGGSVSSFSDSEQDNIEQINRYAAFGGISVGREAASGINEASRSLGEGVGGLLNSVQNVGRSGGAKPPPTAKGE